MFQACNIFVNLCFLHAFWKPLGHDIDQKITGPRGVLAFLQREFEVRPIGSNLRIGFLEAPQGVRAYGGGVPGDQRNGVDDAHPRGVLGGLPDLPLVPLPPLG